MTRAPQPRGLKTIEAILAAAESLIGREGLISLTIDAVAAEGGLSKGGVLHHFRSKEALIAGLVARKTASIRDGTAVEELALRGHPRAALLGMIRHSARQYGDEAGFPPALLVAATRDSDSLDGIRALLSDSLGRIAAEGDRPWDAAMLVFAALGLLLTRTLGLSPLGEADVREVFAAIERAAERLGGGEGGGG